MKNKKPKALIKMMQKSLLEFNGIRLIKALNLAKTYGIKIKKERWMKKYYDKVFKK